MTFLEFCPDCGMPDLCEKHEKTEELSFKQACAAIGRGECVESQGGNIYSHKGLHIGILGCDNGFENFNIINAPYKIVPDPSKQVEPPPSLTYEEALECEKVRIHWPCLGDPLFVKSGGSNLWTADALVSFDLAERRGYRLEVLND